MPFTVNVWWLANWPLRSRTLLAPGAYRLLSVAAATLPTLALIILGIVL